MSHYSKEHGLEIPRLTTMQGAKPMSGASNGNGSDSASITGKILNWVLSQGVSTVILAYIIYLGSQSLPAHSESIKAGYREQSAANEKVQIQQQIVFERSLKQVIDSYERQIQLMERRQAGP